MCQWFSSRMHSNASRCVQPCTLTKSFHSHTVWWSGFAPSCSCGLSRLFSAAAAASQADLLLFGSLGTNENDCLVKSVRQIGHNERPHAHAHKHKHKHMYAWESVCPVMWVIIKYSVSLDVFLSAAATCRAKSLWRTNLFAKREKKHLKHALQTHKKPQVKSVG